MFTHGNMRGSSALQRKTNASGFAQRAMAGVERATGVSLDDVNVHYNSGEPGKYGALAFTRGTDVHLAPGQERHLGHELGHVVQQKRGSVPVTMRIGGVGGNDNPALESEADRIGAAGGVVQLRGVNGGVLQRKKKKRKKKIFSAKKRVPHERKKEKMKHLRSFTVENEYDHLRIPRSVLRFDPSRFSKPANPQTVSRRIKSEAIGEAAAHKFATDRGFQFIYGEGAGHGKGFDQIYIDHDLTIIIEAKGGGSQLVRENFSTGKAEQMTPQWIEANALSLIANGNLKLMLIGARILNALETKTIVGFVVRGKYNGNIDEDEVDENNIDMSKVDITFEQIL